MKNNPKPDLRTAYLFLALTVLLRAANPVLFKQAAITIGEFTFYNVITNIFYLASFVIFFFRSLTWQITLSKLPLSFAYPFMSLGFVAILLTGYWVYDEVIRVQNLAGCALIILGLILLARGKKPV